MTLNDSPEEGETPHQHDWIELGFDSHASLWTAFNNHLADGEEDACIPAQKLADSQWIRVFSRRHQRRITKTILRIYVLPDDVGRRYIDRRSLKATSNFRQVLERLVKKLDKTSESWEGVIQATNTTRNYHVEAEDNSLFYLFNTIPSPSPTPSAVSCPVSSQAIRCVLGSHELSGLTTPLYPYQKRTVATMIRREVEPEQALDPRFQPMKGPTAQIFYYDNVAAILLRDGRRYDEARGGILGESMGLGKTLICLATVLATKGHWPEIPPEYTIDLRPIRRKVGSLMQMAAATVGRTQIPWRALLQESAHSGVDYSNCRAILEDNVGSYFIPPPEAKYSRRSTMIPMGKRIRLSTATLIVVPQNLLSQWRGEISKHVQEDILNILYLDSSNEGEMPSSDHLLRYDIILMSRPRFEKEMVPSESVKASSRAKKAKGGCLCSLDDDCHCPMSEEYQTPLKDLHFLRIIMDEGHEFSSSGRGGTANWALRNLRVDRKWIVSGTPTNGLLGVEVGVASQETDERQVATYKTSNRNLLEARRRESALFQERKDLEKLGTLVTGFLQVKPWANSKEDDPASWQKYIMPHQDGRRKARSLKTLLESLVVRHRIEDIEADIQLPSLNNKVVYLQPSWHDKLNINLFMMNLTANAITSERVDEDYMFHPKNRRQLNTLINNLRQSGFYWTGIAPEDILKTLKVSRAYLDEHASKDYNYNETDRRLLEEAINFGELVLESLSWKAFANLHEMGMFVENFPKDSRPMWSLVPSEEDHLLLVGATPLAKAQAWVDSHLYAVDPCQGLASLGTATMQNSWRLAQLGAAEDSLDGPSHRQPSSRKSSPRSKSGMNGTPRLTSERTVSRAKLGSTAQNTQKPKSMHKSVTLLNTVRPEAPKPALKSALKVTATKKHVDLLPSNSPLARSKLYGTASAKLSYLLDQVILLHRNEKTLIFYDGDHIAWYIAQALDLVDIRYLIYTKSLTSDRQTAYIATFNTTETFRVLLMNVHQAAHGLHIASASRVFFVNPVWQPNVEAQAIKRAHRIGQKRPVYVETLVLKDTLEDQMLQRRKGMTAQEHQKAERSLLDDDTMSSIIKNARFIPLTDEETSDVSKQVAKLQLPQQLFGRPGKGEGCADDPNADLIFPVDTPVSKKRQTKQKPCKNPREVIISLAPTLRSQLDNTCSPGRLSQASPYMSDEGDIDTPGPSDRKRKINHEHAPDLASPPAGWRVQFAGTDVSAESSTSENAQPGQASVGDSRSISRPRRVGFALDTDDVQQPSLFGGNPSTFS